MDCGTSRRTFGEDEDGWMSFESVIADYRRNLARLFAEEMRKRASADEVTQTPAAPVQTREEAAGAMLCDMAPGKDVASNQDRSRGAPSSASLSAPRGVAVEPGGIKPCADGNGKEKCGRPEGRTAVSPGVAKE